MIFTHTCIIYSAGIQEWDSYIVSIAKSVPKEIGTLTQSINFFSSEAALSR